MCAPHGPWATQPTERRSLRKKERSDADVAALCNVRALVPYGEVSSVSQSMYQAE